jgi:predicted dehydrogenase
VAEDLLERMFAMQAPRKTYADYDAMLADPSVDAVIVADQFHVPMALKAPEACNNYVLGHASHLLDTVRFLGGKLEAVRTRFVEKFGAYCWFSEVTKSVRPTSTATATLGVIPGATRRIGAASVRCRLTPPSAQHAGTAGNRSRRIVAPNDAGSSPVGHPL